MTGFTATIETPAVNSAVFYDRTYTVDSLGSFTGHSFIKMSNEDKHIRDSHVQMKLRLPQPLTVYVAKLDNTELSWLYSEGYTQTNLEGVSYHGVRQTRHTDWSGELHEDHYGPGEVWEKTFPAGAIELRGNNGGDGSYVMFVGNPANPPTPPAPPVLLLAHQGVPGWFPASARTTFNVNEGDPSASSFMNIGSWEHVHSDLRVNGKYHFRLVYGGVTEQHSEGNDGPTLNGGEQVMEWTQTSWLTATAVTGYEPITAGLAGSPTDGCVFHGLAASSTSATVIDGSPNHGNWFHSVGSTSQWGSGIPAFKGGAAQTMSLYVIM